MPISHINLKRGGGGFKWKTSVINRLTTTALPIVKLTSLTKMHDKAERAELRAVLL